MRNRIFLTFVYFLLTLTIYLILKLLFLNNRQFHFVINNIENVSTLNFHANQDGSPFQLQHLPRHDQMVYRLNFSKKKNAWISIGIPTVKRPTKSYLVETISSLLKCLNEEERKYVILVVFIAEVSEDTCKVRK